MDKNVARILLDIDAGVFNGSRGFYGKDWAEKIQYLESIGYLCKDRFCLSDKGNLFLNLMFDKRSLR